MQIISRNNNIYDIQDLRTNQFRKVHIDDIKAIDVSRYSEEDLLVFAATDYDEYVIQKIVSHKGSKKSRNLKFQVKWFGYDESQNQLLPTAKVKDSDAFKEYIKQHSRLKY